MKFTMLLKVYLLLAVVGSLLLCRLFSGCGNGGLLSSRSARASHCGDFSCGAQTLGHMGSVVVAPGL